LGSISAKTGFPPLTIIEWAVETKVNAGRITSLFLILTRDKAKFNAEEPLFTAIQFFDLRYFWKDFSNFKTFPVPEPDAQKWLLSVLISALSSSMPTYGSNNLILFFKTDYELSYAIFSRLSASSRSIFPELSFLNSSLFVNLSQIFKNSSMLKPKSSKKSSRYFVGILPS